MALRNFSEVTKEMVENEFESTINEVYGSWRSKVGEFEVTASEILKTFYPETYSQAFRKYCKVNGIIKVKNFDGSIFYLAEI